MTNSIQEIYRVEVGSPLQKVLVNNFEAQKQLEEVIDIAVAEERKRIAEILKPTKEWEECVRIVYGNNEVCAMCGFSPKKLINLINNQNL